jgi:integrase
MMRLSEAVEALKGPSEQARLRARIESECPLIIRALRLVDARTREKRRARGYSLVKRENKTTGFTYYVRYRHGGKMLPSKWNTGTNAREEAEKFAEENRERLIGGYLRARGTKAYEVLENFYREGSEYYGHEAARSRALSEETRRHYHLVTVKRFAPFLKEKGIRSLDGVTAGTLEDFQDALLAGGLKPQTVNDCLKAVKRVFAYLARKRRIKENPYAGLKPLTVRRSDYEARGCHETGSVQGVFNEAWENETAYLLSLLIHTTGMRNGEIGRLRMTDIVHIKECHFIDIKESKTENGLRLVPLHDFVYEKLKGYAKGAAGPVFERCPSRFTEANAELGRRLGKSEAELKAENITFYSGRHFWKTLMNAEGLGEDIEEVFMGHKVTGDVAKRYNHRDRQGQTLLVQKAKKVFAILDRRVFLAKNEKVPPQGG